MTEKVTVSLARIVVAPAVEAEPLPMTTFVVPPATLLFPTLTVCVPLLSETLPIWMVLALPVPTLTVPPLPDPIGAPLSMVMLPPLAFPAVALPPCRVSEPPATAVVVLAVPWTEKLFGAAALAPFPK